MLKFVFTCGGTAGHINPAIAVASNIVSLYPDTQILFIGAEGQMECELVPRAGFPVKTVTITNISREHSFSGVRHNVDTVKNVFASVHEARSILREFRPDAVIGTGGYVCYPVITAAHELHIPTVIHESNAVPGLTTKLLSTAADRILVGVESAVDEYHHMKNKVAVTGTPVRTDFNNLTKSEAKSALGLGDRRLVVSVWGSLGAGHMNELMLEVIPGLQETNDFILYHVTGGKYYGDFMQKLNSVCPDYEKRGVRVFEYIHDMATVMSAADLVVCRSGASTLSELTYMGKPSLLVPSPNVTGNHQEKNARVLEKAGAAKVHLESELDSVLLLRQIIDMVTDDALLEEMSRCAESLSYADSVSRITDIILSMLSTQKGF